MKNPIFVTIRSIYRTVDRLAYYRKCAADYAAKNPQWAETIKSNTWRYWKTSGLWDLPNNTRGDKGQAFTDSVDQIGVFLGESHELIRHYSGRRADTLGYYVDHYCGRRADTLGYYVDHYCGDTIKFGVCRLRSPCGVYYVPVTWCTAWDGTVHYLNDMVHVDKGADSSAHESAIIEAARNADYWAEKEADEAREFAAKDAAEQDIETARETIHETNKTALQLIREIKNHGNFSPAICQALREKLADYLNKRREQFDLIAERERDYWTAVNV